MTPSLAERAHTAAIYIRRNAAPTPYGSYRDEDHARTAVRLAAALGLDMDQITITPDWLRRRTTPGEPLLATATCPVNGEKYIFLARHPGYDGAFELLGPCPACAAQVPLATIRYLADLGAHLAHPPLAPEDIPHTDTLPDTFTRDEAHITGCQYGRNT